MVGQPLTDLAIRKLRTSGQERVELWDTKIPGFGVRASPAGTKSFILIYRPRQATSADAWTVSDLVAFHGTAESDGRPQKLK